VLARMIFNAALMLLMNLISLLLFMFLLGYPLAHPLLFLGISCFGACSISLVFSFLAAIAARAQQNAALMAILGFPLIIPQLMLMMRLSTLAFSDVFQSGLISIVLLLACFDIMVVLLSVILFPFLWKD
jgi:heme exporter protein B